MIVFVVLHDNYGDQGVDFHGVFSTQEKAKQFILSKEQDEEEFQNWGIVEVTVDSLSSRDRPWLRYVH